jgi:hypothetical protein
MARPRKERDYDFAGVVSWFAARADVILFLFDPDKPGTTGETLEVLRHIREHHPKVRLVLNKVDDFESIADLARCFGTLTWNLARVLQADKDMPRIVPMFVPSRRKKRKKKKTTTTTTGGGGEGEREGEGEGSSGEEDSSSSSSSSSGSSGSSAACRRAIREEFAGGWDEIERHVYGAPARACDNAIRRLGDDAAALAMHATVLARLRERHERRKRRWAIGTAAVVGAGALLTAAALLRWWRSAGAAAGTAAETGSSSSSGGGDGGGGEGWQSRWAAVQGEQDPAGASGWLAARCAALTALGGGGLWQAAALDEETSARCALAHAQEVAREEFRTIDHDALEAEAAARLTQRQAAAAAVAAAAEHGAAEAVAAASASSDFAASKFGGLAPAAFPAPTAAAAAAAAAADAAAVAARRAAGWRMGVADVDRQAEATWLRTWEQLPSSLASFRGGGAGGGASSSSSSSSSSLDLGRLPTLRAADREALQRIRTQDVARLDRIVAGALL